MAVLIIKATTVALIGAIAAVAAAIVSFCIWATPWVRRLSGRDLVRTLRTEGVSLVIDRAGPGTSSVDFSLQLRNESDIAVSRFIRKFDISWGMTNRSLQGEPPKDDIFERQSKSWQAQRFVISDADISTFTIDYTIDYGRLDKKPSKRIVGQRIVTPGPTTHGSQNLVMAETHPDRHLNLKPRIA